MIYILLGGWIFGLFIFIYGNYWEVLGTTFLNTCAGFTRLYPSILAFIFYALCFYCLSIAMKTIDLNVVYALWGGCGIVLVVLIAVFILKEPVNFANMLGVFLLY